jgi:hypothetical protein
VPAGVRAPLERAMHTDFADVVLRERSPVPVAAGALALIRGLELHVAPGVGPLDRPLGRRVVAHELAHLTQGPEALPLAALERDADARAAAALRGGAPRSGPLADPRPAATTLYFKIGNLQYATLEHMSGEDLIALQNKVIALFSNNDAKIDDDFDASLDELNAALVRKEIPVSTILATRGKRKAQAVLAGKTVISGAMTTATHGPVLASASADATGLDATSVLSDVGDVVAPLAAPVATGLSALGVLRAGRKSLRAGRRADAAEALLNAPEVKMTDEQQRVMTYAMHQNRTSAGRNRTQAILDATVVGSGVATLASSGAAAPALAATAAVSTANSMRGPIKNLWKRAMGTAGVERIEKANLIYDFARTEYLNREFDGPFLRLLESKAWGIIDDQHFKLDDLNREDLKQALVSRIYRKLRSR